MRHPVRLAVIALLMIAVSLLPLGSVRTTAATTPAYQGFGSDTPGGTGGDVVHVTTLADSGPGSLREALTAGHRTIVFDVAGVIQLLDHLWVRGAYITIDGLSAPAPGITLNGFGLVIRGTRGAHDVIVRGLRVRNAAIDGIQVSYGGHHVVVDHVSIHGSADGNLDITDSRDVTVSWSILAEPAGDSKNMLIKYNPAHVTLHHNLFVSAHQRNPQARIDDAGTPAIELTVDMRNNIVWEWRNGSGALVWYGAAANIVNNFFGSPGSSTTARTRGVVVCRGECDGGVAASIARAWVDGNVSWDGANAIINGRNTEIAPFAAAPVDTEPTCLAAARVMAEAGVQPLDTIDTTYLQKVQASMCSPM